MKRTNRGHVISFVKLLKESCGHPDHDELQYSSLEEQMKPFNIMPAQYFLNLCNVLQMKEGAPRDHFDVG